MAYETVFAGDVKTFTIDGVVFPVLEKSEFKMVTTIGTNSARLNETKVCHDGTLIVESAIQKAGVMGITICLVPELEEKLINIRDNPQAGVEVILTTANGDTYLGQRMALEGEFQINGRDRTTEISLVGGTFSKS